MTTEKTFKKQAPDNPFDWFHAEIVEPLARWIDGEDHGLGPEEAKEEEGAEEAIDTPKPKPKEEPKPKPKEEPKPKPKEEPKQEPEPKEEEVKEDGSGAE